MMTVDFRADGDPACRWHSGPRSFRLFYNPILHNESLAADNAPARDGRTHERLKNFVIEGVAAEAPQNVLGAMVRA